MVEAVLCIIFLCAAVYDYHTYRLPDVVTLGAACFAIICLGPHYGWESVLGGSAAGYIILKSFQWFMYTWRGRQVIGSGDAKLMLPIGALVGVGGVFWVPVLAVMGAILVQPFIRQGCTHIPFGPFLVGGTYAYLLIQYLTNFYLLEHVHAFIYS